jgi:phosphoglycerate dehydrogenase-like enzyme
MPAKILFTRTSAEIAEDAREMSPAGFEFIVAAPDSAEDTAALPDTDCLPGYVQGMDGAFYRTAQKPRLVQWFSPGCDRVKFRAARRAGPPVANNGGANSRAVAGRIWQGPAAKRG